MGKAGKSNVPGMRMGGVSWTDNNENLWLFGGSGIDDQGNTGLLNDLWMYNTTSFEWTWVGGSKMQGPSGKYGSKGIPSIENAPGGCVDAVGWTDKENNLWLFSGRGLDKTGTSRFLNDLWKYDIKNGTWTWLRGSDIGDVIGNYGVKGQINQGTIPGVRARSIGWADPEGNLWFFGGAGYDGEGNTGKINDLWQISFANLVTRVNKIDLKPVTIFPNPAQNYLQVTVNSGCKIREINIYDLSGKSMNLSTRIIRDENGLLIDVDPLQSGMYILQLIKGDRIYRVKFLKR